MTRFGGAGVQLGENQKKHVLYVLEGYVTFNSLNPRIEFNVGRR
jgi:hypothetical protein